MKKIDRPKLIIPLARIDYIAEALSLVVLIVNIIMIISAWGTLPETIPTHFNILGQIDKYGSKATLLFLLPIPIGLYLLLTFITRLPHLFNYAVKITSTNAEAQYRLGVRLMRWVKLELIVMFTYIQYAIISAARTHHFTAGVFFLPVSMTIIFGTIGYYFYRSIREK